MSDLPVRLNSWIEDLKPKETAIPSGLRCQDQRITTLIEDLQEIQKAIDGVNWKCGAEIGLAELQWYKKSAVKKKENLKNLLNDQENRRLLLAEMTLMLESVVDKSKGLEYGDDSEEHF